MVRQQIIIQNKLGLHTRAAAKLVDIAKKFQSKIELICHDRNVDCKSIMSVITLGARKGAAFDLVVSGDDENEALKAVVKLIDDKFNEKE
ncbi:MAG: phosphocarrier protein HPr [Gammaproteobacteria bacterium RIFCSPHIGHO2_12_FULL_42_13]|nr:MAG: phosphocarrier protein HPr [Gammaproteobacteria bacterium RIFCSPHIGHO2_12_FULL_42_13]